MTSLHKELADILQEEKKLLKELYSLVSKERDAIVSLDSKGLEEILREKEALLVKISLWEKEREKLLKREGLEGKTLSEIIEIFSKDGQKEEMEILIETYRIMKSFLSAIEEIQKINEQLIDHSLIHIGTALKFFESFGIKPKHSLSKEA